MPVSPRRTHGDQRRDGRRLLPRQPRPGRIITAGTRTTLTVGLLAGTFRLVNRAGGTMLDIEHTSTADDADTGRVARAPERSLPIGPVLPQTRDAPYAAAQVWQKLPAEPLSTSPSGPTTTIRVQRRRRRSRTRHGWSAPRACE
ncbi:hypothetical protein [Streptomyces europaeiscabiei]|uniref:Uncharacterized protein n=1 Tax=Streptomyces europaeiscabiei TaxID=146819 RepID=A0ABU4NIQ4_9ACTN|nr:hypothetical protein [Streptomyces europaeiscabiei]MDX3545551.1 hypothetical protein [Streptomyces europaeiscabiei]MDX3555052.1 hypothetical protein [Streptomyces europaeiscabiei]MDX3702683.1 hypothetical protein [Streptomyces europaeiscabiei]MDX3778074.1 hypothetical protein [Streptomyces europaeiscabiei]MDX3832986.1 hypothetical protein [Streptomyces europaeiscabiei]